jgi:hypothetical protein
MRPTNLTADDMDSFITPMLPALAVPPRLREVLSCLSATNFLQASATLAELVMLLMQRNSASVMI